MTFLWVFCAGFWSMERMNAFMFMLSRPIVVAFLMGAATGRLGWCIIGGIFFEIIGLNDIPVGTRIPVDDTFGAFAYCFIIAYTGHTLSLEIALLALIASFLFMLPISLSAILVRWLNKLLYRSYMGKGQEGHLIFWGQALSFMRGVLFYSLGTLCAFFLFEATYNIMTPKTVTMSTLLVLGSLISGYFLGFFHTKLPAKFALFSLGGVLSWLLI